MPFHATEFDSRSAGAVRRWPLARWLDLPWPPGFLLPNCPCCPAATGQFYHVFGGGNASGSAVNSNYQWTSGGWLTKAAMTAARYRHAGATPAAAGPAYVFGGNDASATYLTLSESYSPDAWAGNTSMPSPGRSYQAGLAISGNCYSWGGQVFGPDLTQNDQMTPGSPATWATKAAAPAPRQDGKGTYIAAKGYLFCGYTNSTGQQYNTNYQYDPSGDSWTTMTSLPSSMPRQGMFCWTIAGAAYVVDGGPTLIAESWAYVVDTWAGAATSPHSGIVIQDGSGASIDAAGVGWISGGLTSSGAVLNYHDEYVPNAWAVRAVLPANLDNMLSLPA